MFNTLPDIATIASILGGETIGENRVSFPTPGHSPKDRGSTLRVSSTAPDGFVVHSFNAYDSLELKDYVREKLGLPGFAAFKSNRITRTLPAATSADVHNRSSSKSTEDEVRARSARAFEIWSAAQPIIGTLAESYLNVRGITLPTSESNSDALRFLPAGKMGPDFHPLMLAAFRNVQTGEFVAIHRTAIHSEGHDKAVMSDGSPPRKMFGPVRNSAIQLIQRSFVRAQLGVAEGIETALAVSNFMGMPVWSVGSASNLASFPVITGIEKLVIWADHDEVGISAAKRCGRRWLAAGADVSIRFPKLPNTDWADWYLERRNRTSVGMENRLAPNNDLSVTTLLPD